MSERFSDLLQVNLQCDQHAPAAAREALCEVDELGPVIGDAMLVASELVTNAVRHSGCRGDHTIEVRIGVSRNRLLISVHDPGITGRAVAPRIYDELGIGGWGLRIVEQLSRRWGSERPDGYRVWAELSRP